MENNFIEKIRIAELDPTKVYFLQICAGQLKVEQFQHINKILKEEFEKNQIKNILLFTPSDVECKFTEVVDGE